MSTLASRYVSFDWNLALGIQPMDAMRDARHVPLVHVVPDGSDLTDEDRIRLRRDGLDVTDVLVPRAWERHPTGRHVVRYQDGLPEPDEDFIDLRVVEGPHRTAARHFVPRRLRVPVRALPVAELRGTGYRVRRPGLFPGAAYPMGAATAVRGRAFHIGRPLRWVRVEVVLSTGALVGRAHGDDRGEFLAVLSGHRDWAVLAAGSEEVTVRVFWHATAPPPPPSLVQDTDPHWDLPLEELPDTDVQDPVTAGEALPDGYALGAQKTHMPIRPGRTTNAGSFFVP